VRYFSRSFIFVVVDVISLNRTALFNGDFVDDGILFVGDGNERLK
jgi:hypothetical protein